MQNTSTIGNRLPGGQFSNEEVPARTTVRHAIALTVELGSRADVHDAQSHPFTNWGWKDRLDHELAGFVDKLGDVA